MLRLNFHCNIIAGGGEKPFLLPQFFLIHQLYINKLKLIGKKTAIHYKKCDIYFLNSRQFISTFILYYLDRCLDITCNK